VTRCFGHLARLDAKTGGGEIHATDGRLFSVHRTGFDETAVPAPGTAVTFVDEDGRYSRARHVRRVRPTEIAGAAP